MSCSPKKTCPEVTDTHDPVVFTVLKIPLGWIPQQTMLVTDSAPHNSSDHLCQQLLHQTCLHTPETGDPPHPDPPCSTGFHFQLNSATFNCYLWSSGTGVHSAAPGTSWDKQDKLRLSQFFQSEMLPLHCSANPLALILVSPRLSPSQSTTLCRD